MSSLPLDAPMRALLQRLPAVGVLVLDRDLRVVLCEGGAFTAAGWDPRALEGRLLAEVLPADAWAVLEPEYRAALTGKTRTLRMRASSGLYKVIASPLDGDDGTEGVFVITADATDDVRADELVRETQALLRAAFDAAAVAMIVFSVEAGSFGRVVQANGATARLFGYPVDDLIGSNLRSVLPPDEVEELESSLRRMVAEGTGVEGLERRLVDARGRQLWGRLHVSFVRGGGGAPVFGVAQIEDVTRERLREEALRLSQERFGLVFHEAPVGIVMTDLRPGGEGVIIDANEAYAQLVGRPLAEVPGLTLRELTHPDDAERDMARLAQLVSGEIDRYDADKRYVRPDGSVRAVRLRAASVTDDQGRPLYGIGVAIDVTDQLRAEAARDGILDSVFEGVIAIDEAGRVTVFNRAAEQIFGTTREAVLGRPAFELFVPPELHDRFEHSMRAMRTAERDATVTEGRYVRLLRADGTRFPAELSVRRTGRDPVEFSAFVRDLTEERRAERRRRGAEDLFRTVFEHSAIPMAVLNLAGLCLEPNSELCAFLGRTEEELRSLTIEDVTHPEDHVPTEDLVAALAERGPMRREKRFVRGDGRVVWGLVHSSLLYDENGRPRGVQAQIVDITARREANARLGTVLESLAEGVLVVDGHGAIESVNPAALRMLGHGEDDLLGRPVEYVVPVAGDTSPIEQAALSGEPVRVEDASFVRADGSVLPASYSAAPLGAGAERGVVVIFSDISEHKAREHNLQRRLSALDLLEQTRSALRTGRLLIYSQPILDLASGEVVQEELLLRMLGDDGEIIPPGDFLPVAEEYGLIAEIDRWVIGQAARLAAMGRRVEVNVSGKTLGHRDLTRWVDAALAESGADPQLVTFEITETALTNDLEEAARFAEHVARLGCNFALDDFGTGYGSFTLLKRLPVAYLKIDIEFVRNIVDEEADRHVVQAVVSLARGLGMRTIAEGVETQETLDLLTAMGVDYAQGYLIGRPEPT